MHTSYSIKLYSIKLNQMLLNACRDDIQVLQIYPDVASAGKLQYFPHNTLQRAKKHPQDKLKDAAAFSLS